MPNENPFVFAGTNPLRILPEPFDRRKIKEYRSPVHSQSNRYLVTWQVKVEYIKDIQII